MSRKRKQQTNDEEISDDKKEDEKVGTLFFKRNRRHLFHLIGRVLELDVSVSGEVVVIPPATEGARGKTERWLHFSTSVNDIAQIIEQFGHAVYPARDSDFLVLMADKAFPLEGATDDSCRLKI